MKLKQQLVLGTVAWVTFLYWFWLRPGFWNLGFTIINLIFLSVVYLTRRSVPLRPFTLFLGLASGLIGIFMAVRSLEFVRFLSWWSIVFLDFLLVALLRYPRAILDYSRIVRSFIGLVPTLPSSFFKLLSFLSVARLFFSRPKLTVIKGVVYSLPLLLIFGSLFYSADPIFASLIDKIKLPRINLSQQLISDLVATLIFASVVLSLFKAKFAAKIKTTHWLRQVTETNVAVAILEVLFAIFVAIQLRYFSASPETFRAMGIIYSVYTREGYQQLITAAILALGVVLWLDYSIKSQKHQHLKSIALTKTLATILVVEIFVLVISATKRNYFYQLAYGYTEIRLLGFALSSWMIAMLTLVGYKIVKNKTAHFLTVGTIVITAVGVLGLNIANVDAVVVRQNPARTDQGTDYEYLVRLSDDAYEAWGKVLTHIESTPNPDINQVRKFKIYLQQLDARYARLSQQSQHQWNYGGSWNWSSRQSLQVLQSSQERIDNIKNQLKVKERQLREQSLLDGISNVLNNLESKYRIYYPLTIVTRQEVRKETYFQVYYALRFAGRIPGHDQVGLNSLARQYSNDTCELIPQGDHYLLNCTVYY